MTQPNIIDAPGDYQTRNGRKVTIHAISEGKASAPCQGAVWRMFRGRVSPRGYRIWSRDGRALFVGISKLDIIGPWPEGVEPTEPAKTPPLIQPKATSLTSEMIAATMARGLGVVYGFGADGDQFAVLRDGVETFPQRFVSEIDAWLFAFANR